MTPAPNTVATPALEVIQAAKLSCTKQAERILLAEEPDTQNLVDLAMLWRKLDSQSWEIRRRRQIPVRSTEPSWVQRVLSSSFL